MRAQNVFDANIEEAQRRRIEEAQSRFGIDHQNRVLERGEHVFQFAARAAFLALRFFERGARREQTAPQSFFIAHFLGQKKRRRIVVRRESRG